MFKQTVTCFWQSTEQWLIYTFQLSTPLSFRHLPYSRGEVTMRSEYAMKTVRGQTEWLLLT